MALVPGMEIVKKRTGGVCRILEVLPHKYEFEERRPYDKKKVIGRLVNRIPNLFSATAILIATEDMLDHCIDCDNPKCLPKTGSRVVQNPILPYRGEIKLTKRS